MSGLSEAQQRLLAETDAAARRRYIEEHSETMDELRNAEETLRGQGFDPGTGMPL